MNWAYDTQLKKWVVILQDIVMYIVDTEKQAKKIAEDFNNGVKKNAII